MRIGDLLSVVSHPTVARLEHLREDAAWITEAYHVAPDVERHLAALRRVLSRPTGLGMFLVGAYGSGKSHLLAYVARLVRGGGFVAPPPAVVPISLLHFSARQPLEEILARAVGAAEAEDRRARFGSVLAAHPDGLVVLFDELSEFLRSKPDPAAYHEDVRFLQFLGELAQDHRLYVIAAMQEQIEHTGDLGYAQYRKIKDRYPIRMILSPAHTRDVVATGILRKHPGYAAEVERFCARLRESLPGASVDFAALAELYPLHPVTLELLEEIRDSFSQARGVVEFVVTRLGGDPARGIAPLLDEPFGTMLAPDAIVDHFRDLLELQPEFQPLAQKVFPYYQRRLAELFGEGKLRDLAARALKLLVLCHISPRRQGLTVREAAEWLLLAAARIDPEKNLRVLDRVLGTFATEGQYVKRHGDRYLLDLEDDSATALEKLLAREAPDVGAEPDVLFELAVDLLDEPAAGPLAWPRERWLSRPVKWHFHERPFSIYVGDGSPPAPPAASEALVVRLAWGESRAVPGVWNLVPARLPPGTEWIELGALVRLRGRPLAPGVRERVERRLAERLGLLVERIRAAYADAQLVDPDGRPQTPPVVERGASFDKRAERLGEWIFRRRYPSFERFAPSHGTLSREAYRALLRFAQSHDLYHADADDHVQVIREGYLVPMGLLVRKNRDYAAAPRLDRHELIRLVTSMLPSEPPPSRVYERLAEPVYGLVPDQVHLLLLFLLYQGELDLVKEGRSYLEIGQTFPLPSDYDRVVPARALAPEALRDLVRILEGLGLPRPKEWTVLAQRTAAATLRRYLEGKLHDELLPCRRRLAELAPETRLVAEIDELTGYARLLEGRDEIGALKDFLGAVGAAEPLLVSLSVLGGLPRRLERYAEARRLGQLLGHPTLAGGPDEAIRRIHARVEDLGEPPAIESAADIDAWLDRARALHAEYATWYRERHDSYWSRVRGHPLWGWKPPAVARSRHLGLERELQKAEENRTRAAALLCRTSPDLLYAPRCACGYDGDSAPIAEELRRLERAQHAIDQDARAFFAEPTIRARLADAPAQGVDGLRSYLSGGSPWPEIDRTADLDAFLAGIDRVKEIPIDDVVGLFTSRTWERERLLQKLGDMLARHDAPLLRFRAPAESSDLLLWCVETALSCGAPLPPGLSTRDLETMAAAIRPEWVGGPALLRLESLGVGDAGVERVLRLLLDGAVDFPPADACSSLVLAARELVRPTSVGTPVDLAELAARLYRAHPHLLRVAPEAWLARLDELARAPLSAPPLVEVLRGCPDRTWVVIDCLGLPFLPALRQTLPDLFPSFRLESVDFATVSATTTTEALYRSLAGSVVDHPFEKVNALDRVVHERDAAFDDLCRLGFAELRLALGGLRKRLDLGRSLLVFGDHGFRLSADGKSYRHGGASTLERTVPVLRLAAR